MKFCPKCAHGLIRAEVYVKQRLKCPAQDCGYVFWDNPAPVIVGIVEYDG